MMGKAELNEKIRKIKLLMLDVDGVFTNGWLVYDSNGGDLKCFDSQDGTGTLLLKAVGIESVFVTIRPSKPTAKRAEAGHRALCVNAEREGPRCDPQEVRGFPGRGLLRRRRPTGSGDYEADRLACRGRKCDPHGQKDCWLHHRKAGRQRRGEGGVRSHFGGSGETRGSSQCEF